jgi:hypothetical protein
MTRQGDTKMLPKDFVLCKSRDLLNEFIAPIIVNADKPRRKFLRQTIKNILLSSSLVFTANVVKIVMSDLVEHFRHSGATANLDNDIVFCKVLLVDNPKWLYVVTSWLLSKNKLLISLNSVFVENIEQARHIIRY